MEKTRALGALLVLFALSGCGGGGGGDDGNSGLWGPGETPSSPTPPPTTPPASDVQLTLSTPPISTSMAFGSDIRVGVAGQWTASGPGGQVFLQVADDHETFVTPEITATTQRDFSYQLPVSDVHGPSTRKGTLTVRACEDAQCAKPYAKGTQTLAYTIEIQAVPEWETTQGNAAHNGYVSATLDVAKFTKAWEWKRPGVTTTGATGAIFPPVTSGRIVYVTANGISSAGPAVFAINEKDGSVRWTQPVPLVSGSMNPPAASERRVYVPTTGHGETFLWSFDGDEGTPGVKWSFDSQWSDVLAPTVKDGIAYVNAGSTTGVVYAFDRETGLDTWQAPGGTSGMNTPAVDDAKRLYTHDGDTLLIRDAITGTSLGKVGTGSGSMDFDYIGTPIVGAKDSVTALVGPSWTLPEDRQLRNYAVDTRSVRWTSVKTYRRFPAVAKGVVYATSNNPLSLDALDETTGQLLWSWSPAASDNAFIHNVVVTDNLAFVSTTRSLYAIDLVQHKPVWQVAAPGYVAISGSRMIYVMTGVLDDFGYPTGGSDGRLLAYRTR